MVLMRTVANLPTDIMGMHQTVPGIILEDGGP